MHEFPVKRYARTPSKYYRTFCLFLMRKICTEFASWESYHCVYTRWLRLALWPIGLLWNTKNFRPCSLIIISTLSLWCSAPFLTWFHMLYGIYFCPCFISLLLSFNWYSEFRMKFFIKHHGTKWRIYGLY